MVLKTNQTLKMNLMRIIEVKLTIYKRKSMFKNQNIKDSINLTCMSKSYKNKTKDMSKKYNNKNNHWLKSYAYYSNKEKQCS